MLEFCISHELDTDPDTFWRLFFDDEYNDAFYASVDMRRRVVSRREDDGAITVVCELTSKRQLPGFVRKLLGNRDLGCTDTSVLYKDSGRLEQVVEPTIARDRTAFRGCVELEPIEPGRVRRVYRGSIDVSIPLIGGRIERATVGDMQRTHDIAVEVTRQWLAGPQAPSTAAARGESIGQ